METNVIRPAGEPKRELTFIPETEGDREETRNERVKSPCDGVSAAHPKHDLNRSHAQQRGVQQAANLPCVGVDTVPRPLLVDTLLTITFTIAGLCTRMVGLERGDDVIWDEAHFGLFASYYLRNSFYSDVHPPLAKMMIAGSGWLAGYNGTFDFASGATYPPHVPYVAMRRFVAFFGGMVVPMAYITAREMGMSVPAATAAAFMVLCDNALVVTSRFILLDPILLFFVAASLMCVTKFHTSQRQTHPHTDTHTRTHTDTHTHTHSRVCDTRFNVRWYTWLCLTGISIGCATSAKSVGLFTVALIGLYTVYDLWSMLAEPSMRAYTYVAHWVARIFALILLPTALYLLCFAAHFAVLKKPGPGAATMSTFFQATLNTSAYVQPLEVEYGSSVTLRSNAVPTTLLHSHALSYPGGSKQQQVTGATQHDENDWWIIMKPHLYDKMAKCPLESVFIINQDVCMAEEGEGLVRHMDIVRLVHMQTRVNLHSHHIEAADTSAAWEVSGYGRDEVGDLGDHWRVEIEEDHAVTDDEMNNAAVMPPLRAVTSRFRLVHVDLKCALRQQTHGLPEWAAKQREIVCDPHYSSAARGVLWNVEQHRNDALPNAELVPPEFSVKGLLQTVVYYHAVIANTHEALTGKRGGRPMPPASRWHEWPLLTTTGIRMTSWDEDKMKFFMLGNPVVWYMGFWGVALLSIMACVRIFNRQRGAGLGVYTRVDVGGCGTVNGALVTDAADHSGEHISNASQRFEFNDHTTHTTTPVGADIHAHAHTLGGGGVPDHVQHGGGDHERGANGGPLEYTPAGRGVRVFFDEGLFDMSTFFIVVGWALHYVPFGVMGRVLYLHHYLPALYLSAFALPLALDRALHTRVYVRGGVCAMICAAVGYTFVLFSPLSYGFTGPAEQRLAKLMWTEKWRLFGSYP